MDFLHIPTRVVWSFPLESDLDQILLDHTHWEKESARWCLNLLLAYCDNEALSIAMTRMINQKLARFQEMRELLKSQKILFIRQQPIGYDKRLKELIINKEPERVVDRLLISALQEARSYERFAFMAHHIDNNTIAEHYHEISESDPRNYDTFIDLATCYQDEAAVCIRLDELAAYESSFLSEGSRKPRLHS